MHQRPPVDDHRDRQLGGFADLGPRTMRIRAVPRV